MGIKSKSPDYQMKTVTTVHYTIELVATLCLFEAFYRKVFSVEILF